MLTTFLSKSNDKLIIIFIKNYNMSRISTIKEIFELLVNRRKFHMFPIIILLIALIGVTALAQSGLVAFYLSNLI